jgi:imidazolonepropionase-like amidohydrolase
MRAIRAAHAFDGTRLLPGGATVLWDGERIVGVEAGRPHLPVDVEVLDLPGTLLPGLVDCHSHLVADATVGGLERIATMSDDDVDGVIEQSLRAQLAAGVTTVRDLGDRGYRTLSFAARSGLPRVVCAGPPITTPGGHCHFLGGATSGSEVAAAVDEHVERGVHVVKVMASGGFVTPGSDQLGAQYDTHELRALVERAHAAGVPVTAHAHSLVAVRRSLEAGVDGIEHFTCLTDHGADVDDELLDEVARRGVRIDLTMGNDPAVTMPMPPPPLAALLERLGLADFANFHAAQIVLLGRLRHHGVAVATGVDSGIAPPKAHGNVQLTVGEMVRAGYPAGEALAVATSGAAEACGLQDETGRLAPGLAADLLVVDGDPGRDPAALGHPRCVVVRGTVLAAPDLRPA